MKTCEFCYKQVDGKLPSDWDLVWQSCVCPDCKKRVKEDGGYNVVKGGAYSSGPDPREKSQ